jgi:hypothetical protein
MITPFTFNNESQYTIDINAIAAIRTPRSMGKSGKWHIKIFFTWRHDSLIFEYEDKEVVFDDYNMIMKIIKRNHE